MITLPSILRRPDKSLDRFFAFPALRPPARTIDIATSEFGRCHPRELGDGGVHSWDVDACTGVFEWAITATF